MNQRARYCQPDQRGILTFPHTHKVESAKERGHLSLKVDGGVHLQYPEHV